MPKNVKAGGSGRPRLTLWWRIHETCHLKNLKKLKMAESRTGISQSTFSHIYYFGI
jgi:hypothetical protein